LFNRLKKDIAAVRERDPAARNIAEILLLYPGLHAIMLHRPANWLYRKKRFFLARFISEFARFFTGVEIHPGAEVGKGVFIDHGSGIVIGETAAVGDGCTLYQGVTLGGTGKDTGKRHPTLGQNVMVGAGAIVLGPFEVGDNAKIAAGAVVLSPVPPNVTAVGVPARIVDKSAKAQQLDQVHTPDPVSQEICRLLVKITELEKKVERLEKGRE